MHEILGIQGRDVRAAVIDMCYSMIELKLASKKDKYVSNVCYLDDTELSFENVVQFWRSRKVQVGILTTFSVAPSAKFRVRKMSSLKLASEIAYVSLKEKLLNY